LSPDSTANRQGAGPGRPRGRSRHYWRKWLAGLFLSFSGTLVGTTLVLMPWGPAWDQNYLSGWSAAWYAVWINPFFRGAVSGVGALNIYLALADVVKMARGGRG